MEKLDEETLYEEIEKGIKKQLNRSHTKNLTTEIPSLKKQKEEVLNRHEMKMKFERIIKEKDYIAPPIDDCFADFAMKKYILEEYPSEDEKEINSVIKKYVGKERENIPNQFEFVIDGEEERLFRKMRSIQNEFPESTKKHIFSHIEKAVPVLQKVEKERNDDILLSEPPFLNIHFQLFTCSLFEERIPVKMDFPFSSISDGDVCFICQNEKEFDKIRSNMDVESFNYKTLFVHDLEEFEHDPLKMDLFVRSYDFVVMEERVQFDLYGKDVLEALERENKLIFSPSIHEFVKMAKSYLEGSIFNIKKGDQEGLMKVGMIDMSENELRKNAEKCVEFLIKYFGERKIKMLDLQTKNTPKLYIFKNMEKRVESPKQFLKKRKRDHTQKDEEEEKRPKKKQKKGN